MESPTPFKPRDSGFGLKFTKADFEKFSPEIPNAESATAIESSPMANICGAAQHSKASNALPNT